MIQNNGQRTQNRKQAKSYTSKRETRKAIFANKFIFISKKTDKAYLSKKPLNSGIFLALKMCNKKIKKALQVG
jgi:hypothetical protein